MLCKLEPFFDLTVAQMKPKLKVDNTFYCLTDTQAQIQADLSDTLPHACKNAVY